MDWHGTYCFVIALPLPLWFFSLLFLPPFPPLLFPFTLPPFTLPPLLFLLLVLLLFLFLFLFPLYFLYSSLYSSSYPSSPLFFFLFLHLPLPLPLPRPLPLLRVYKESPDVYFAERNRPPTWSHRSNKSPEIVAFYCQIAPNPAPKNSEKTAKTR